MKNEMISVVIVEDENELARLHAELVSRHPRLQLAGMASSLADARALLASTRPPVSVAR
ncbi:Response regulator of citrate/malate metabolism [Shimwellia blattae]|nr:Response regulator of citrate/malate metabolism [Shimwellia blattae]